MNRPLCDLKTCKLNTDGCCESLSDYSLCPYAIKKSDTEYAAYLISRLLDLCKNQDYEYIAGYTFKSRFDSLYHFMLTTCPDTLFKIVQEKIQMGEMPDG